MSRSATNPILPRLIDPRKFAQQGLNLSGEVKLSELQRVSALVLDDSSGVRVVLEFIVDEERHRIISGSADCVLKVTCQRCLEPVDVPVSATLKLAIVWDEDGARQLPKTLDPLILGEGQADLYTIIEDELLLSLPMASYHPEDCIAQTSFGEEVEESTNSANPFQVLEQLKGSPKS
ncbi:MAG: nucleic acid-binding protein [Gammaproteobacteria bacterium]|uniref:YceD family protein n=1 Tax=Pseudomaricurvus alcaniphilus TaxID=1166482 RepID=UPI00140CE3EB|nr:YceD family protein [Pseudomaricurvus alcaniphilus]MBR9911557.1 nucleic acid-binding protein [Gammaproteobacteria bacterium]NHN35876.1 nucleic acid-binding protein [Pseudomaricurvus alcaniphilus]